MSKKISIVDTLRILPVDALKSYENNPRRIGDNAVEALANSIKEFGFKVPIVIDKDNVIVAGHTRLAAVKKLGLKEVPCIVADDLSEQQVKAFRLADNKTAELSLWDFEKLDLELDGILDIDMSGLGFDVGFDKLDDENVNDGNDDGGSEVDLGDYGADKFEHVCPRCGLRFNDK